MKSLNDDKGLWTKLSVEELEKREEYTKVAAEICCFELCCFEVCCFEVCCFQISSPF